ncbi:MAG: hypothetical protein IKS54_06400 [Erysipelotrichaceae bacterium]|nr:hypothetical protein [Erysipelotrichaceae bacterium]
MIEYYDRTIKDIKRLMPYSSFTEEEKEYLESLVNLLKRLEKADSRIYPTTCKRDFDNHAKVLDSRIRISSMIREMLSDAEERWNTEQLRKFKKGILETKIENIRRR